MQSITLTADNLKETMNIINDFCKEHNIDSSIVLWEEDKTSGICNMHNQDDFCYIPNWATKSPRLNLNFLHEDMGSSIHIGSTINLHDNYISVNHADETLSLIPWSKYSNPIEYYFGDVCPVQKNLNYL